MGFLEWTCLSTTEVIYTMSWIFPKVKGFLSFLSKIHFITDFNRLLLLSRLAKIILPLHQNVLFVSMSFSRQVRMFISMNWILTTQETKSNKKLLLLVLKIYSIQPVRQSSSLVQIKSDWFCPKARSPSFHIIYFIDTFLFFSFQVRGSCTWKIHNYTFYN